MGSGSLLVDCGAPPAGCRLRPTSGSRSQTLETYGVLESCSGVTRRHSATLVRMASPRTPTAPGTPPRRSTRPRAPSRLSASPAYHARDHDRIMCQRGPLRTHPHHHHPGSATPARNVPRSRVATPHHQPWRLLGTTSHQAHPHPRRQQPNRTTSRHFHSPTPAAVQLMDPDPAHRAPPPHPGQPVPHPEPQPRITPHIAAGLRDLDTHGHGADRRAPRSNVRGR